MGLRLDGYIRVSRIGGRSGEGYISPDEQREAIERYARELDGEIVAWHPDEDYSGGTTDRPAFQRMLTRLEAHDTDGVVVMAVDRFARSTADGYRIIKEILGRGQVFAACHERMDPRTPEGAYMLRSFLSNSELYLDQVSARWNSAKGRAIARGAHIGPTPVGYLKVDPLPTKPTHISPVDSAARGGPTSPGVLTPRPVFGPAMTGLFERAAKRDQGDTALARWYTETAPHPSGRPWHAPEVRRWLSSRVYLGEVRHGDDLVNPDAHEPLTDEDTWQRCQRPPGEQLRPHSTFFLSGMVRCAYCRYAMGGQTYGGASGDTPVYRCNGRSGCKEPTVIVAARLDEYVVEQIRGRLRGLALEGAGSVDLDQLDRDANEAEAELQAFAADLEARRMLGEAGWRSALEARGADRDAKVARRDEAFAEHQHVALARRLDEIVEQHDLRDLLAAVRHVFIRRRKRGAPVGDRTLLVWSDDPRTIDVPGPHRSGPFEPIRW